MAEGNGQAGGTQSAAGAGAAAGNAQQAQQQPPRLNIVNQYIKDLSFENPRSPQGLSADQRPEIQIGVEANAKQLGQDQYEIVLDIKGNAKVGEEVMFVVELSYGAVFNIQNVPTESLQPILMIECPRLIFPFARRVVGDVTRDGGFPPLMIDPIDFVGLYRRRLQAAQAAQQQQQTPAS